MRRLGGGVDDGHDIVGVAGEQALHRHGVTNVGIDVAVAPDVGLETPAVGRRAGGGAEEGLAHVVVDADHVEALVGEQAHGFGADQPRRPGNHR